MGVQSYLPLTYLRGSDEVQKYLPSHTAQRSTLKITIGWLVLAVYLDGLKRRLVVNTFKLHQ